ncbi:hypothetical protein IVB08_16870 [Bradyrhizobium sp. 173]|uniref:hypothetical protein n=1 Tax=Bradyrhizobium sp. 173 TaxID=2782644 RepID=UPI001FF8842C|nr:hypothetical protein [Bradyrhizobium sp. 173]MCK1565615.1 hypothetical protein [Bradyrhizobium sp. 173]
MSRSFNGVIAFSTKHWGQRFDEAFDLGSPLGRNLRFDRTALFESWNVRHLHVFDVGGFPMASLIRKRQPSLLADQRATRAHVVRIIAVPEQFADLLGYPIDCNQIIGFRQNANHRTPHLAGNQTAASVQLTRC